jgi:hypothetical protein
LIPKDLKMNIVVGHDQRSPAFHNRLMEEAEKLISAIPDAAKGIACTTACLDVDAASASAGAGAASGSSVRSSDSEKGAHADPAGAKQQHSHKVEGQEGDTEQVCLHEEAAQSRAVEAGGCRAAGSSADSVLLKRVATWWGWLHVFVAEVPLPVGCNNPLCPAAVDELVATRKCTGCKLAVYCSDDCLKEHWEEHEGVCRRVKGPRKRAL